MSKIIVFGNEKGGSGKTTKAFHVAIALLKSSYKILTIDTDIRQKSFTRYLETENYPKFIYLILSTEGSIP